MSRLAGRKLLLTRSAEGSSAWAEALSAEGAVPIVFPCIETEACAGPELKARIESAMQRADWLVFTSRRGVDAFANLVRASLPATTRLAAVGKATAERAVEQFGRVDLIGGGTASVLATELAATVDDGTCCVLALAANAGDTLERRLADAGATVTRFDLYRTVPAGSAKPKRALSALDCDQVIFASPTAVAGFNNRVNVDTPGEFVTIGPSTSAAVRRLDWDVAAEAKEPSLSGIIESILETGHV